MAISCLAIASCRTGGRQEQAQPVYGILTVHPQSATLSETYPASVEGRQDISIYPQVAGTISKVCVTEGRKVRKGESLFIIDQVPYKAALQMARANVSAAEAGVATAELVFSSREKLYENGVISDYDLQTSRNQLLTARAQLEQARANEVTALNNMEYTLVKSPADGVVGTLPYREGALVSPSIPAPLTTVSDNSQMYVYFSITESGLLELTRSHSSMEEAIASIPPVSLVLIDGSTYSENGYVETISGVVDKSTGSVSARAVFPNPGRLLHSGTSGRVVIERQYENAVRIPCSATFEIQDRRFVYKVIGGKTAMCPVQTLLSDDGKEYIVTEGLEEGDVIVTEGVGMLRDGQDIRTAETEAEQ